jgi:hypothetical protein
MELKRVIWSLVASHQAETDDSPVDKDTFNPVRKKSLNGFRS